LATKLQFITGLSEQATQKLSSSYESWTAFLNTAAWNYKYSFSEQVLIHAQRPNATACAPIELWNEKLRRWVNRGAKGIALIDDSRDKLTLRYVFDISDTNSHYGEDVYIWTMGGRYCETVTEALENSFGELENKTAFADALVSASSNLVDDNLTDYLAELMLIRTDSFLEELDDLNVEVKLKRVLRTSVAYMLMVRCGVNAEEYFNREDFTSVLDFNTLPAISLLGNATSDISEIALREIGNTVRSLHAEERRAEKFALSQNNRHNRDGTNVDERSFEYGAGLHDTWRLPAARPDTSGAAEYREIWDAAKNVSEGTQEIDIYQSAAIGEVDGASVGNRPGSAGTRRTDDGADGRSRERERGDEGLRSDEMDGVNEQPEELSGRDNPGRNDLQLELDDRETEDSSLPSPLFIPTLPSEIEQITMIEQAESKSASALLLPQEVIDEILTQGSGLQDGKLRIYLQLQKNASNKENADFLKHEYGIGGRYPVLTGTDIDEVHDGKGIHLRSGKYSETGKDLLLTWPKIAKRIGELIAEDRYLTEKEKECLPAFERELAERVHRIAEQQADKDSLPRVPEFNRESAVYACFVGAKVQIGADAFDVLSFNDERVILYDPGFPLFNKEMPREEYDRKVRENPLNDHLIIKDMLPFMDKSTEGASPPLSELQADDYDKYRSLKEPELDSITTSMASDDAKSDEMNVMLSDAPETLKPYWEKHTDNSVLVRTTLISETPPKHRINFKITDDELGYGGPKTKYAFNVAAIVTLQSIEAEGRLATAEEQETLSRYVGWGGIPDAFDENKPEWAGEYTELRNLLSNEEYRSARESTLNAHYTSPVVIKAIYSAIESMGFRTGNVLEPSCGVGNFLGLVPESMGSSRLYGVELDSITGRIAQQLYQRANIHVQGFETADLPDSFFDIAVGNVPFGQYSVPDKRYDKLKLSIHDYFFAKTLDKVRPGGVVAFITSSFTMDKKNPTVRKYIAQRAELLGAIRLPNNAFLKNAGTSVVSDILFLQKRDRPIETEPDWVHLGQTVDGFTINQYFITNPDMVLGQLSEESTQYGHMACTCAPIPGVELAEQLRDAMANIHAEIIEYDVDDLAENEGGTIPADPTVRNFSFAIVDDRIYYRENSRMNTIETSETGESRIRGMIQIRDCVRQLIEYQTEDYGDEVIRQEQVNLNEFYDQFAAKYGLINSRGNSTVFSDDSSYPLLCSLEILDEEGNLKRKADMFSKRTIRRRTDVTHVDTASEALAVSIGECARVDLGFMASLMGKQGDLDCIIDELRGVIFKDPESGDDPYTGWQTADEYLSGNVRTKLAASLKAAENNPAYAFNVEALQAVQPIDLTAAEISVRLGATWLPPDVVEQFVHELLSPAFYIRRNIRVHYMPYTSEWNIEGKNQDRTNVKANATYGTDRANAYKILEETLNLRDIRVFDAVYDDNGNRTYVLNKKETAIARQKQALIKQEFTDWIWKDPDRRERLCRLYNDKFNSIRPREYDGRHIQFVGMNPEMALRTHQINAVARVLYGGNTLLAHVVGAGKTFEMVAAAMESKRLGLCQKSMIVVPNHLTEQWAGEFLQLYPAANILVATRKDFETRNRKRFCGRIATGDYDAVIIGHSQFEKIPLSLERQKAILQEQIDVILASISEAKANRSENFTIKQLEKSRKSLEVKLAKLNDQSRKDDVVTFEELGVDRLFIDESHFFKNLFLYTKMRNVGGIAQTEAQKSSDLFAKCRYLDELTGERGVVFATGTPISNSMVELYTVQRYLQYDVLRRNQLQNFDAWASNYGETVTAIELSPEGTGYRGKTRFAKFYNLPELMSMFKEVADIQTADMLNLPVPTAIYHNIALKPSDLQREMVASLSERADRVRNKDVSPDEDNMLMITNDGRKLALDQRLMNPMLPDHEDSKAASCVENAFTLWHEHTEIRATQLIFCDLSTPKGDGSFNVYDDIRDKLISKGVPAGEIAYIHDANTETRKKELFGKVRSGQVRILMGSTFKMGAGTNVQDRLIAIHNLDCPWRPADLEQRAGRIIRQGNQNPEVHIFRYVTEGTFDAYLYQIIENKQRFISQIMTSKTPVRSAEDIDEAALSYAEVKALATGNPYIKEKMGLEADVANLRLFKANYLSQRYTLEDAIIKEYPMQIRQAESRIAGLKEDIARACAHPLPTEEKAFVGITLFGINYTDKGDGGRAVLEACKGMNSPEPVRIGNYRSFELELSFDTFERQYKMTMRGALSYSISLGVDAHGNITRMDNALAGLPERLDDAERTLENTHQQLLNAKAELERPFIQEEELKTKTARLAELDALLNLEQNDEEILNDEPDEAVDAGTNRVLAYAR
jgi:N12 class adenine-specific DNA methylase